MGKKPKQWSRRNSMWVGGDSGRGGKGDKGNQAEDSNGWEDDERRRTDVVGRRIFKANSITFCCCTAFVGLAPLSSSACSFPSALPFPQPSSGFYNFLLVRCVFFCRFSLFLILFFVFILLGIRKWTSLENKNHMQSAQSAKGTQTEEGKRRRRGTGVRCLRKCISFLIFFRRKIEMRFIYYVFHFWTNNDSTLSLSLSCLLAHSSHWYLHSSFSIHSASLENVSTSYYVSSRSVCLCVCTYLCS